MIDMTRWEQMAHDNMGKRKPGAPGRLSGRISIVTGSAQGFGKGIAQELHQEGASVLIAALTLPLAGSNKNFAYAGGKFGGIGLVQSFAMELAPYRIKVNAICPGNYYDGPLWSDPEKGLFVQYLRTGKVPGAKTVEDVRASYLAKTLIPRGCTPLDVARAVFYCVEQTYETGQAIPVTGGQVMLK